MAAAPAQSLSIPARLGRYEIVRELGSGGMATVYLARSVGPAGFEKLVALKTIHGHLATDSVFVDMFLDEARIASRINHPNVSVIHDFGEADDVYYLAMEFLFGQPLQRVLRAISQREEPRDLAVLPYFAARIIAEGAEGLHAAHELRGPTGALLGIVHRDVSPQNLFVTFDGSVKVVDFGCAQAEARISQTQTGTMKGKVAYAAPEQIRTDKIDRRADVWGLGVCLWEMLTLRRLFRRQTEVQTAMAALKDEVPAPSSIASWVPPQLDAIVLRALSRDRAKRYPSARALGKDLRAFLTREGRTVEMAELSEWMEVLFPGEREALLVEMAGAERSRPDRSHVGLTPREVPALEVHKHSDPSPIPAVSRRVIDETEKLPRPITAPEPRAQSDGRHARLAMILVGIPAAVLLAVTGYLTYQKLVRSGPAEASTHVPAREAPPPSPEEPTAVSPAPDAPIAPRVKTRYVQPKPALDAVDPSATASTGVTGAATNAGEVSGSAVTAPKRPSAKSADRSGSDSVARTPTGERRRSHSDEASAEAAARPLRNRGRARSSAAQSPEPVVREPVLVGRVDVQAEGGYSEVYLGRRFLGTTPLQIDLPVGRHELRLLPFGKEPGDVQTVSVYPDSTVSVKVRIRSE